MQCARLIEREREKEKRKSHSRRNICHVILFHNLGVCVCVCVVSARYKFIMRNIPIQCSSHSMHHIHMFMYVPSYRNSDICVVLTCSRVQYPRFHYWWHTYVGERKGGGGHVNVANVCWEMKWWNFRVWRNEDATRARSQANRLAIFVHSKRAHNLQLHKLYKLCVYAPFFAFIFLNRTFYVSTFFALRAPWLLPFLEIDVPPLMQHAE